RTWVVPAKAAGRNVLWHARGLFWRDSIERVAKHADVLIAISDYVKESCTDDLRDKVVKINNPIWPKTVRREEVERIRKRFLGEKQGALIGCFSRLDQPRKNIKLIGDIARKMVRDRRNVHFVVCGRGSDETK